MHRNRDQRQHGSTLVVTISVVATVITLLGAAVSYTQLLSRQAQRTRKTALALEIADGHLEHLFTHWRNLSRVQVMQAVKKKATPAINSYALPTQYFFTDMYNPGPAPSPDPTTTGLTAAPPIIPLPPKSFFPTEPNYVVTQYRIQAVDPMVDLQTTNAADPELSTVPVTDVGTGDPAQTATSAFDAAFGPNTSTSNGQYSFYYLASADVQVPALGTSSGYVKAKVRRVFEKKYDEPFTFALLYMDDLELQPSSTLTITGPVHSNASLYIGTSNFTAATPTTSYPTSGRVTFSNMYVNGASPNDPTHTSFSAPTFATKEPPMMWAPFLPFGWDPNLTGANTNNNNAYHELIERPDLTATSDPIWSVRFYNQADYIVLIQPDSNGVATNETVHVYTPSAVPLGTPTEITNGPQYNALTNAITTSKQQNQTIQDNREGGSVRLTTVDVGSISKNVTKGNGAPIGMIYISDINATATSKRGIRLIGPYINPATGITVVSENPVYIQGDYNTGMTGTITIGSPAVPTATPPSDAGGGTSASAPTVGTYWKPAAIVADAITLLSNNWSDAQSAAQPRPAAKHTTVNAALVTGNVPSDGTHYSGGAENFVRLLEDWSSARFTFYGSMVQLWQSAQGTGAWTGSATVYTRPSASNWFYDIHFAGDPNRPSGNTNPLPPGNFQLSAYLQQQRWYQVY